jgi:hypothetical protein
MWKVVFNLILKAKFSKCNMWKIDKSNGKKGEGLSFL